MSPVQFLLLLLFGFSAGFITAAAYVAFIAMIGIFPKIAAKTKTAKECILYENVLMIGVLCFTLLYFCISFSSAGITQTELLPKEIGIPFLILFGLFGGVYTGFLIGGLSEVLNILPIYARKTHIKKRISYTIYFLAIGKGIFAVLHMLFLDR